MRVLFVSTYESAGGAARAAQRIRSGLQFHGIDAPMFVQSKSSDHPDVYTNTESFARGVNLLRPTLDQLPARIAARKRIPNFSCGWLPGRTAHTANKMHPDVVHLHWVNKGFVDIGAVPRFPAPIVWTLHDMWPFTGGCHHSAGCDRYQHACGACPQLESAHASDLSSHFLRRKSRAWEHADLTIVCPSRWLASRAEASSLFGDRRIEVIANGLDTTLYRPVNKAWARDWLQLPQDKLLLLFCSVRAAENPYKGFEFLPEILSRLAIAGWQDRVELIVIGASQHAAASAWPLPVTFLGHLADERLLALIYAAADVFLAPSRQDVLPSTVMEAMACGTPCVAYATGGIPEMIEHEQQGYLAPTNDVAAFVHGIHWLLANAEQRQACAELARLHAQERYDHVRQAGRHIELYDELLDVQR